jgi:hypothetical protein
MLSRLADDDLCLMVTIRQFEQEFLTAFKSAAFKSTVEVRR